MTTKKQTTKGTAKKAAASKAKPTSEKAEAKAPAKKTAAKPKAAPAKAKTSAAVSDSGLETVQSATAASILGDLVLDNGIKEYTPKEVRSEWKKYYKALITLREQIVSQMDGLAKESAEQMSGYSLHMADSGTDNFDRDFALSLLSSDQDALYEVEEALKRIEKGTFGVCEITGNPIPKARLEAIPWTRFTVDAQAQLEREGAMGRRRLGSLGSVDSAGNSSLEGIDDNDDNDGNDRNSRNATQDKD